MGVEYKLSYTATEIDERLGKIDDLVKTVNGVAPDENGNVEISASGSARLELTSPDGTKWVLSVDDTGTVFASKVSDGGTSDEEIIYSIGEPSDFDYSIVGNGIYLKEYIGEKPNLEIPTTMELDGTTYSVFLWNLDFSHSAVIERIKIDDGVASYGDTPIVIAITKGSYGDTEDASPVNLKSIEGMENLDSATVYPSFKDCVALERIPLFPEGATGTRNFPFWNCDSLTDISYLVIPAGITSISGWFANCDNLEVGCTIPTHIENANQAFSGCPNLKSFRVESLTATIDDITTGLQTECEMECYSNSQAFQTMKANAPLQAFGTDIGNYLGVKAIDNDILSVSCFGDSLTHGQGVAPNYPTVLDGLLPEKSIVYDYGYGGSSMEGIRDRMSRHQQRLVNDVVVIWAGTNGSAATESIQARLACTDEMISLLQTDKYIIMTPVYLAYSADIDTAYAEKYGSRYFSLRDWFDNNDHDISQYVWDGTHFNADGNNLIGQAVYEKMVELGYIVE